MIGRDSKRQLQLGRGGGADAPHFGSERTGRRPGFKTRLVSNSETRCRGVHVRPRQPAKRGGRKGEAMNGGNTNKWYKFHGMSLHHLAALLQFGRAAARDGFDVLE